MPLSTKIEDAARRMLFHNYLAAFDTSQAHRLASSLSAEQLAILMELVKANEPLKIGQAFIVMVHDMLRAKANTDASMLAAQDTITQADVEKLL